MFLFVQQDDKEMEATIVNGNVTETGHIIVTTIGGRNGQPKQTSQGDPSEDIITQVDLLKALSLKNK